ncbi:MAG: autotransporter outer membrane beta-barrel domain-containing protein [Candidatus Omnitrophota bacterium]
MRFVRFTIIGICLMLSSSFAYAGVWEVSADHYVGAAIYSERDTFEGTNVESDCKSFYEKVTLNFGDYDKEGLECGVHYGMFFTAGATETWDIDSVQFQTNDMRFWGLDTSFDVGWAFPIEGISDFCYNPINMVVTPFVGYRWKFIRFTRDDFNLMDAIVITETVDEDFYVNSIDVGGKLDFEIGDKLNLFIKPILGMVIYNTAYNSVLGSIDGSGGLYFDGTVGLDYAITDDVTLGLSFRTELQRLQGGEKDGMIWPDNSLDTYGGNISIKYLF